MNAPACLSPLAWPTLLAYRLGELDSAGEARIEEHYLGCAFCAGRLERLTALGLAVRVLARESGVAVVINDRFVRRLTESGMRVREYRVPLNGSVNCTVAPEDDWVVGRLEAPLERVKRVDLVLTANHGEIRQEDVPFVADSGAVVFSPAIDTLRAMPSTELHVRLIAVDDEGARTLGDYTFNHSRYAPPGTE